MSVPQAPQGPVPALGIPDTQDYPRLVFTAPYFETVALAELIAPAVTEAVEAQLPSLVPPYVNDAANAAVQQLAVLLAGSTMQGPLFLNPIMPTQPSQAASMAYVDSMVATAGIPEVPPTPIGQVWARMTGQWTPISEEGGTFLPIGGGTMQGQINMGGNAIVNLPALPVMPNGAAPAQWVLNQIASVSLYQGTWDMDTYVPDLTQLSTHVNGYTWIAITTSDSGVVIGPPIPGLQGQTVFNGDTVIYSTTAGAFQSIHAGGLSLPEAQALFLQLAGGQMSGALLLNANATQPTQAVTLQQMQTAVAGFVAPDAPTDGQAYLRIGATQSWTPGLPLTGGITTGAIMLSGNASNALQAVPYQQLVSYTAGLYLPLTGGAMTGLIQLSGNAAANNNPVALGQLNSMLGSYLPLAGGAVTGPTTFGGTLGVSGVSTFTAQSTINTTGGTLPTLPGTPPLRLAVLSNPTSLYINSYGTISTAIVQAQAGGTPASPVAMVNGQMLGGIQWSGWNGSAFSSQIGINAFATQAWTTAQEGSQLVFYATANGTTAPATVATFGPGAINLNLTTNIPNATLGIATVTNMLYIESPAGILPDSDNNINIGLPNGQSFAAVSAYILRTGQSSPATGQIVIGPYTGSWGSSINTILIGSGGIIAPYANDAVNNGYPGQAWSAVNAYAFNNQSDPRSKKDAVQAPQGALDLVRKIMVQRFHWKTRPDDAPYQRGLMADEVLAAVGEDEALVHVGGDADKTLSLDQSNQIAWLWQAVQELAEMVQTLASGGKLGASQQEAA